MPKKNLHVVQNGVQWSVRRTGSSRSSYIFKTKNDAIEKARDVAVKQHITLYIHDRGGQIIERNVHL